MNRIFFSFNAFPFPFLDRSTRSGTGRWPICRFSFFFLFFLSLIAAGPHAPAQTWHWAYGQNATVQEGKRGVRFTTLTCGDIREGYIAVGSTDDGNPGYNIYVVRTSVTGAAYWEKTFDLGSTWNEFGESIIEVEDGFVVVGHTDNGSGNIDVLLMKIECDGDLAWLKTFGGPDDEYGYDVIEAATGAGQGELVVAGTTISGGQEDAYLLRTDANGNFLWDYTYDLGNSNNERFHSLTEVAPIDGQQTQGDIVAVGSSWDNGGQPYQGFVVRADGTDGTINTGGGLLQGAALYGGDDVEEFYSVIELKNPDETGREGQPNVVIAGYTMSYSEETVNDQDVYLVKLSDGNPCSPALQRMVGHIQSNTEEVALCIREIPFPPGPGGDFFQWDIAVAGYTNLPGFAQRDMLLFTVYPTTLNPSGPTAIFGHPDGNEEAWSVWPVDVAEEVTQGFVLCGLTDTWWHIPDYLDPQDLYLVKTNNQGRTYHCDEGLPMHPELVEWDVECPVPDPGDIGGEDDPPATETPVDWDEVVCTNEENDGLEKRATKEAGNGFSVAARPNPAGHGKSLVLLLNGFDPEADMTVTAVNPLGETVASEIERFTPSTGEILLKTAEWPAGVYLVTIRNGDRGGTVRVIVLEN